MRRKEREITINTEIEEILKKADVCRIGLVDGNSPYVIPVNYAYFNGMLYIHSALEGRKINIIKKNNNVCFEVDIVNEITKSEKACNWSVKYESVIGYGKAFFVESNSEKKSALNEIMKHYDTNNVDKDKVYEYNENMLTKVAIIRIEIDNMTGKRN